jgi:hypothetical protein
LTELGLMLAPVSAPAAPRAHVPDEFDAPAPTAPAVEVIEPAPTAPCREPSEPAPCPACVPVVEPAPAVLPGDRVDPGDCEADPELWPDGWDDHIWNLGPDV